MKSELKLTGPLAGLSIACLIVLATTAHGQDAAAHKIEIVTNSIGMKLSHIPAGTFQMGSPKSEVERRRDELSHEVTHTKPFLMGVYEVTQAEFRQIMGNEEANRAIFRRAPRHPMENATHKRAREFCQGLSRLPAERSAGRKYRLPTEAEWEYACRAGTNTVFNLGDSLSAEQANFNGNYPYGDAKSDVYLRKTADVGSYKPNAFGLYDMHGNVAEWCSDWYDKEYYYDSPDEDPLGPPVGVTPTNFTEKKGGAKKYYLSVRGGCWLDDARACRSACRFKAMPDINYRLIGFRVVCESTADSGN